MKDTYYVIFTKKGIDRMVKTDGFTLKAGEKAVKVNFEVSDDVFKPLQIPTMTLTVPASAVESQFQAEQT